MSRPVQQASMYALRQNPSPLSRPVPTAQVASFTSTPPTADKKPNKYKDLEIPVVNVYTTTYASFATRLMDLNLKRKLDRRTVDAVLNHELRKASNGQGYIEYRPQEAQKLLLEAEEFWKSDR